MHAAVMVKAGGQLYRVPPGCSDKSCIIEIVPGSQEYQDLLASQDGKVHIANNGILNDLDAATKYAQQHGGLMNDDGSKNVSDKPVNQYMIYAPVTNNFISELLVAGYNKSGASVYLGLTTYEQTNADLERQTLQQGKPIVIDSHSRGTLTTTNAQQWLINNGGVAMPDGQSLPSIQMNNIGAAQNNDTATTTLQTLTNNPDAKVNSSLVHPQDLVGTTSLTGHNPVTPSYNNITADDSNGDKVTATTDGRGPVENFLNILTGKATPHSCYGTALELNCKNYWDNIPTSNAVPIGKNSSKNPPDKPEEKK
jgi:filamentous hemagglutinin